MSTRRSFYNAIGKRARHARNVPRTRAFIKKAAANLQQGNSFFGFEFAPGWTFQARRALRFHYIELLNTKTLDVACAYCRLPMLLRLIDAAWDAHDDASFFRRAPRLNWRRKNVRASTSGNRARLAVSATVSRPKRRVGRELGHGDHWEAFFGSWSIRTADVISRLCVKSRIRAEFSPPWPGSDFPSIVRLGRTRHRLIDLAVLLGVLPAEKRSVFLSAYAILMETRTWMLRVENISSDYGPFEGVVDMKAVSGALLRAFDPRFGENRDRWLCGQKSSVALAGLALRLEPFAAEAIKVETGPLLDWERESLRAEGKTQEAAALDHVMVFTCGLRTLYCGKNDHAAFVGCVQRIREIPAHDPLPAGWLLDIETVPDDGQPAEERVLPVYVFAPALGDYHPQTGDLVQGTVWLQATPA